MVSERHAGKTSTLRVRLRLRRMRVIQHRHVECHFQIVQTHVRTYTSRVPREGVADTSINARIGPAEACPWRAGRPGPGHSHSGGAAGVGEAAGYEAGVAAQVPESALSPSSVPEHAADGLKACPSQ